MISVHRFFKIVGGGFVVMGILGFLASSVALARVRDVPRVTGSEYIKLELPSDNPSVQQRQRQAETMLFGSLACGICGIALCVMGHRLGKSGTTQSSKQAGE